MQKQRHLELQNNLYSKEVHNEKKYATVNEQRLAKAAELKMLNEIKIKNALSREENNRNEKLSKDIQKLSSFENQVKHFKDQQYKSDSYRQHKQEEHDLFRKVIIDRAKHQEKEIIQQKVQQIQTKVKDSEARIKQHQSEIDRTLKKQRY